MSTQKTDVVKARKAIMQLLADKKKKAVGASK